MKASSGQSLEDVFKKWEKKGEERRLNGPRDFASYNDMHPGVGRTAWKQRFDASALPPRRRSSKRKQRCNEVIISVRIYEIPNVSTPDRRLSYEVG